MEQKECEIIKLKNNLLNYNHYFCKTHKSDFHSAETNPKICWEVSNQNHLKKIQKFKAKEPTWFEGFGAMVEMSRKE